MGYVDHRFRTIKRAIRHKKADVLIGKGLYDRTKTLLSKPRPERNLPESARVSNDQRLACPRVTS